MKNIFKNDTFKLFIALLLVNFLPTIYDTIKIIFINNTSVDINIFGQIEWFDLINESLQALLIVPLYYMFQKHKLMEKKLEFSQLFIIILIANCLFLSITFVNIPNVLSMMNATIDAEKYLKIETLGFLCNLIYSIAYIVFLYKNDYKTIINLLVLRIGCLIICDFTTIGINDYSSIYSSNISQLIVSVVAIMCLYKHGVLVNPFRKLAINNKFIMDYFRVGLLNSASVIIANVVYATQIVYFVNEVEMAGSYWIANSFIWGVFLLPSIILGDIIRIKAQDNGFRISKYIKYTLLFVIVLIGLIPFYEIYLAQIMFVKDIGIVLEIIMLLVPFYIIYMFGSVFEAYFVGTGQTKITLIAHLIVNFVYYPLAIKTCMFSNDINGICGLFGWGTVTVSVILIIAYIIQKRKSYELSL